MRCSRGTLNEPQHSFTCAVNGQDIRNVPVPEPGDYRLRHVERFFPIFCKRLNLKPVFTERVDLITDDIKVDATVSFSVRNDPFIYVASGYGATAEEARNQAKFELIKKLYINGHILEVALENYQIRKDAQTGQERRDYEALMEERFRQSLQLLCEPEDEPEEDPPVERPEVHESQDAPESEPPSTHNSVSEQRPAPPPPAAPVTKANDSLAVDIGQFDCLGFCRFMMLKGNMCQHWITHSECFDCQLKFDFFAALFKTVLFSDHPFDSGVVLSLDDLPTDEVVFVVMPEEYINLISFEPINEGEVRCSLRSGLYKWIEVYYKRQLEKKNTQTHGSLSFMYHK